MIRAYDAPLAAAAERNALERCAHAIIVPMLVSGLQKLTLLDYPGKTAATVFTPGCNLRCPFCHNSALLTATADGEGAPTIALERLFAFLEKRRGLLDGVCITGGEPTLQPGLDAFCERLHEIGFAVKLDTNGTNPDRLDDLIASGLVDYVAMDVKNAPACYGETVGIDGFDRSTVERSMELLLESAVSCEFRTTVVQEFHTTASLEETARWIERVASASKRPVESVPWFLQAFVDGAGVLAGEGALSSWDDRALRGMLPVLRAIVPSAALRGM